MGRFPSRDTGPFRKTRVNYEIRLSPIRLIDQDNNQIGVIETPQALRMAQEAGLDLVEIQPDVRPPVCKIMDYGKYKFELSKKERSNRAASKQQEMKEVRLGRSLKIDDHDVEIRVSQARRFLMEGHKVQLVQQFRGREMQHRDIGDARFKGIIETLSDIAKVEVGAKMLGKRMSLILAPDKTKVEALKRKLEKEMTAAQREAELKRQLEQEARLAAKEKAEVDEPDDDGDGAVEGSEAPSAAPARDGRAG
ncbi:MAG: translation initiation factor IF-3 [Planctomycetota bacterium]|nr:translation initiation factor IF-3 [Planctomycetota bacterium]